MAKAMFSKKDKKNKDADAEDAPEAKPEAEGEEGEAPAKKKMAGKTLILFVVLPALLVVGGGGAAAMMMLGGGKSEASASAHPGEDEHAVADEHSDEAADDGHGKPAKAKDDHAADDGYGGGEAPIGAIEVGYLIPGASGDPSYYDMPKMIVNLNGMEGDRPLLLELELVLESSHASTFDHVPSLMPRLMDQIQTFLRELRVEDLNGSAGTYRLRLELLKRFNLVIAPQKLDAVLIEGILIQ